MKIEEAKLKQKRLRDCLVLIALLSVSGCSMSEEMKRIEETKEAQQRREASKSTNLSGEQVFVRSCNTCHPQGKAGLGPTLENLSEHFPDEDELKKLIRDGKGMMPGQPKTTINDTEMDNLLDYLRTLEQDNAASQTK
jgi:mono/diheme cytochrome c family protein